MPFQDELRDEVDRYLGGEIDPSELDAWIGRNVDRVDDRDPEGNRLAMTLLGYLAEYSDDLFGESEFRERVRRLISTRVYSVGVGTWTSASGQTTTRKVTATAQAA